MGMVMGLGQIGLVLGPVVGGPFTEYETEQTTKDRFSISARGSGSKLYLLGFILFAPATTMFLLAPQYGGNKYAWDSSVVIRLFCGAAATFAIFLTWEHRAGDKAMIPFSTVTKRTVACSCVFMFFLFSMVFVESYQLPVYFQTVMLQSPLMSGVHLQRRYLPLPGV
ncbi:MAG: hypothetical protein Q9166_002456 [cf. Caloplaca sp. 2 TL-2023]